MAPITFASLDGSFKSINKAPWALEMLQMRPLAAVGKADMTPPRHRQRQIPGGDAHGVAARASVVARAQSGPFKRGAGHVVLGRSDEDREP
ncbi:hypothetical protein O9K51_04773 [Purpureocillium lavendulum]|uniref:Uncharacterized protein n=1 Tax=Purpureocillium lavendulum TaxID=1247861 RepID=A0AB34FWV4_9HYPO|nr:hypothetical protein O9K51_04773 [Purpureocillium lavendulum]